MSKTSSRRLALGGVMLFLLLAIVGTSFAQDATPPPDGTPAPACVPDAQTACAKIIFYPATLKADLFLGAGDAAQPTAQVQQSTLWVTFANPAPGQTIDVIVKNIHDGGAGEGQLYQYPDIPKNVTVPFAAGQTSTVYLYPVKQYIRGKVAIKCSPQSVLTGEDVACQVTIDGAVQTIPAAVPATPPTPNADGSLPPAPQPTPTMAPGQTSSFILDPGPHEVKIDLVGANASLWPPMTLTKTVTVSASSTPQSVIATFAKAGHIVAKLAQATDGWVGDFYLDGTLVANQVGSIDQWVKGNSLHKVEVKNIVKTNAALIHPYLDASTSTYATSGTTSNVTVTMTKVPDYQLVVPTKSDGTPMTLTTTSYVAWYPVFSAKTADQATTAVNNLVMLVTLDGALIGDVSPYKRPPSLTTSAVSCEGAANVPCYNAGWFIPLGRLAAGPHKLYAEAYPLTDIFVGWTTYSGVYFSWSDDFAVAPAQ